MTEADTTPPAAIEAIDALAIDRLFRSARTARYFTDAPVSDEQIAAIYEYTALAPTLMNSHPLRMAVIRSAEARERLMRHLGEGNRPKTASAPVAVVLAADTAFHDRLLELFPVNPGAQAMFAADDERRVRTAFDQAWLQAGVFVLAARAVGLAVGPMAGFDRDGLDADLLAGTAWRSFLVVNLGQPADNAWHDRLPRLAPSDGLLTL